MSIISDIQSVFSDVSGAEPYTLFSYPDESAIDEINLYTTLEQGINQQNTVATKPLEQSNFSSDSVQIKPIVISIRGVIYPPPLSSITNFEDLGDYIAQQVAVLRNYVNGPQLFVLFNDFSFGNFYPLKLTGINQVSNSDMPVPEYIFSFVQIQTTTATSFSTTDVSRAQNEPQNEPRISR